MGISPKHYFISLEPDLSNFTFNGNCKIIIETDDPEAEVILNAMDLEIKKCMVNLNGKYQPTNYELSLEKEEMRIFLPENNAMEFEIKIKFVGKINDKLAGFYRSKFSVDGVDKYAGVTQFQETDARRAFPCFDNPKDKATFSIEMIVESDHFVISNSQILSEVNMENGKKKVIFNQTPKMSTYLVFFAVGEFELIATKMDDIDIRLITSPGNTKYGELGLDFGAKSLKYCIDYYDFEYPKEFGKMDLIGTPSFAHGAMENWGAILFRENLLLYYHGITSKMQENRILEVIAHEIAHQWFGNLVSPSSWKYVWLNESFATFFAYGIVDHYYPEKKTWETFLQVETEPALVRDAYLETVPIEMQGDEAIQISVKSAPILYNKGGSILRMVEGYLGSDNFRDGLRHYLKKHAYNVATSEDLWISLEEVSKKPINKLMKSWVLQKGYPLLEIIREGNRLIISQRKFTYLPNDSDQLWLIPVSVRLLYDTKEPELIYTLVDEKSKSIDIDNDVVAIVVNTDLTGFYRVKYQADAYDKLGELIKRKVIPPVDRWIIENDMYAFLRAGEANLQEYLDFIEYYSSEDNYLSISSISDQLYSIWILGDEPVSTQIASIGREFLENVLERIGYEPSEEEDPTISIIRGGLINNASAFSSIKAREFVLSLFEKLRDNKQISPDLLNTVLQIAARETNDFDWFINKFESAETEQEKVNYTVALGKFSKLELIEKIQIYIFENIPSRNRMAAIGSLASNPIFNREGTYKLWEWYLANLDNFEKLHPYMYQGAITSIIPQCVDNEDDIKAFFKDYVKKNPIIKDALDIALELMQINSKLKSRIHDTIDLET